MKITILQLLMLALVLHAHAQQITLTGKVSIHNSRNRTGEIEYVKGAYATALSAAPSETDSFGIFYLKFVGKDGGSSVKVQVEKAGLDVVNERELQDVVVGRLTPIKVFLISKADLTKAQTALYDISEKALTATHEELVSKLRKEGNERLSIIADLEKNIGKKINHWYEAEEILNKQLAEIEGKLPETVKFLASINLDFADEMFTQAYKKFENGEIEKAIAFLDENRLAQDAAEASSNIEKFKGELEQYKIAREQSLDKVSQLVNSYRLKAESFKLLFKFDESVRVFEKAVTLLEKVKKRNDLELANAYYYFGLLLSETSKLERAEYYLNKNLLICQELFDNFSPELGLAHHSLGHLYRLLGKYENAVTHYETELELIKANLGDTTLVYAFPAFALADVFYQSGRLAEANKLIQSSIGSLKTYAGSPVIRSDLIKKIAGFFERTGAYKEAKDAYLALITERENRLSENHPLTLSSYADLANVQSILGEVNAAITNIEKVKNGFEKTLGMNHSLVANSYMIYGNVLTLAGNLTEAEVMMKRGIAIYEIVYGNQHPTTADSYSTYALFLKITRNYISAKNYIEKSLTICKLVFGDSNPQTAKIYHILGDILLELGELEKAKENLKKAASVFEASSVHYLNDKYSSYFSLAVVLRGLGEMQSAKLLLKKVVAFNMEWYGAENHLTVNSQGIYALTLFALGEFNDAKRVYEIAIPSFEKTLGPNHQSTTDCIFSYANVLLSLKDYEASLAALEKLTSRGVKNAIVSNVIGTNNYYLKKYNKAIENYEAAYKMDKALLPNFLNNSGMAHAKSGNLAEAKTCFEQLQSLNPNIGQPYRNWAFFYAVEGDYSKALDNLEKAVQLGYKNLDWIETEDSLKPLRSDDRFKSIVHHLQSNK